MQPIIKLLSILFFTCILTTAFAQRKTATGQYITKGYNSGVLLTLKTDKSFTYRFQGHISSDTAAGQYYQKGDTLYLKYDYNNYDSIFASYKAKNEEVPIDVKLSASRAVLRPSKLLKKGKRLYYVDEITGKIKTYKSDGRTHKTYLELYK
jgi:hypothetical protein